MDSKFNKMDEIEKNKTLDELTIKITEFTGISYLFLKNREGKFKNDYEHSTIFLMEIVRRLTFNSMAVSTLCERYKFIPDIEHSIGLILRSSLQDVMHLLYFQTMHTKEDKLNIAELEKELSLLENDQIARTISDNKHLEKIILKKYPNNKNEKGELGMRKMFNKLGKGGFGIYDMWSIYSKYEHYGAITYDIERYEVDNAKIRRIAKSILLSLIGIMGCFAMLSEVDINLKIDPTKFKELDSTKALLIDFMKVKGLLA